jgi:hypothetical protein
MPQLGASLADNSRGIIYDRNMFIVQATEHSSSNYIGVWSVENKLIMLSAIMLSVVAPTPAVANLIEVRISASCPKKRILSSMS